MLAANTFDILAAVDLRGGRVVRLRQGDFEQETTYASDPIAAAGDLVEQGARWLHIVDLDGARAGRPVQTKTVAAIVETTRDRALVEVAGGLRTIATVEQALDAGARRVVLGTAAVRDPRFAGEVVARFGPERVAVAIDLRRGRPVVDGWLKDSDTAGAEDAVHALHDVGVMTFEVTAVERDGLLGGPDLDLLDGLVRIDQGSVIASGGLTTSDDVRAVRDLGCRGAIVGRAIYEGRFDIRAAINEVGG